MPCRRLVNFQIGWILALAVGMFVTMPALGQIIYVDADATDANDSSSANVQSGIQYPSIQAAINAAVDGDTIVLAPGTFRGDGNRDIDFKGKGITVCSTDPNEPNIVAATIIDCQGSDADPHRGFYFHNAEDANSILAGITIMNGYAAAPLPGDRSGGGMASWYSSPAVTNCTFIGNSADYGGGMSNHYSSSPMVTGCTFSGNSAVLRGGGMYNSSSNPTLTGCTFSDNSAQDGGGGMHNYAGSPNLTSCTFNGNTAGKGGAGTHGGGMFNFPGSPTLTDCTFSGNLAYRGGGMSNLSSSSSPTLTDCILNDNTAYLGGGMHNYESSNLKVTGCTFSDNSANSGGGMYNYESSNLKVTGCTFSDNSGWGFYGGGGMYNHFSSPTVTICTFSNNRGGHGGGMYNYACSPNITSCTFNGNTAGNGGGLFIRGLYSDQARPPTGNDYLKLSAGYTHSLALKADGSIVGWGYDYYGQASPPDGNDYDAIAAGGMHSLALKQDGSIVGWGWNNHGQCDVPSPNMDFTTITAGLYYSLGLKTDGSIVAWGLNDDGQASPPDGNDYLKLSAGYKHGLALKADGSIVGWGYDDHGQTSPPDGNDYDAISAGHSHSLALKNDGSIVGWGYGSFGAGTPPAGNDYVAIAASNYHSLALKDDGSIVGWGYDKDGRASPPDGNDYVAIAAGDSHGLALRTDGSIVGWPNYNTTLTDCTINGNIPDGVWMEHCDAQIEGTVEIASNDWIGNDVIFTGDGELQIDPNSTLDLDDSRIRCNVAGTGNIQVDAGTQLTIEGNAIVNLSGSSECNPDGSTGGIITVDGSLLVQDNATLENTNVDVKLLEFGGDNDIQFNNIILLEASIGFGGEFFVDNIATINCNTIVSEGDRYLDLDPDPESAEHPTITDNQITVIIKEGVSGSQGTLLELRAADYDFMDSGAYQVSPNSLGFTDDPSENWVLEKMIIYPNAKLNLTNRQGFEFQDLSDANIGSWETVYVKELVMGPNAVLNTAFQTLYYQDLIIVDYDGAEILRNPADVSSPFVNGSRVEDIPLLGFSLAIIAMDDPTAPPHNEFDIRVRRRIRDPQDIQPEPPVPPKEGSIERIDDDPNIPVDAGGVMDMRTRAPGKQSASSVAAKGAFARAGDEDITIEFEYMFIEDPCDEAEMIVYLSDEPEVGQNLVEVARIRPPARGRPGSIESDDFAIFSGTFSRGDLNFVRGTYVELQLRGTNTQCWIDNWDPKIYCQGAVCGDYDGMNNVTFIDYLYLLAEFGLSNPGSVKINKRCLDLIKDGVINAGDLHVWSDANLLSTCGDGGNFSMGAAEMAPTLHSIIELGIEGNSESNPLAIFGKPGANTRNFPDGSLYRFDVNGTYVNAGSTTGNGRIVTDSTGKVYQIDARDGLIGSGECAIVVEPKNSILFENNSRVSVGIKDEIGLPLSDAAFDPYDPNIVYIVPVLVTPPSSEGCPYMAAAKLELTGECNYKIKKLYGKNPAKDCNNAPDCNSITDCDNVKNFVYEPDVQHLCEIEIDLYGNLYVLSSLWTNDNNWVLIYNANVGNASEERVWLNEPNLPDPNLITGPTAMVVSSLENKLYLASSANTLNDPDDLAAKVFSFTIKRVGQRAFGLTYQDPLVVNCPAPNLDICGILPGFCEDPNRGFFSTITSMTEKPTDGTLYVTGFTSPKFINDYEFPLGTIELPIFTTPLFAVIPTDIQEPVDANVITGCDMALPLSIVWTGSSFQDKCGGADIDNSGDVSYLDLSILALQWLQTPGIPSADIAPEPRGNGIVNFLDFTILADHWLENGCN